MRFVYRHTAPGKGWGSKAAGLLLVALGLMWLFMAAGLFNLYWHRDHYREAELEVTAYHYHDNSGTNSRGRRTSSSPNQIEGILHPGGQQVFTNDRDVSVMVFASESSAVGRQPTRGEVEGQRYKVIYWPDHQRQWWEPASIMTSTIPAVRHLVLHSMLVFCLLGGGVLLVRRGNRRMTQPTPPPAGPGQWPHWTGGAVALTVFLWVFFVILISVVLTSDKLSRDGTERLARTTKEWIVGGIFATCFGVFTLIMTGVCLKAVRQRLRR